MCIIAPMDAAARLEQAQDWLERGLPARAAAALSGPFPAELRDEALFLRAEALRAQGYFDRAAAAYRLLLARRGLDAGLRLDSWLGLASIHRSLGSVPQARQALAQARRLAEPKDDRVFLEDALIDRAEGLWARCLSKLGRLLSGARRARDFGAQGFLLWATGGARRFSGDLAGSRRDFEESLRCARKAGDAAGQAYALFGLGGVSRILGRLADSDRFYAEAGRRLAATDDVFGKAYAECGLANALRQRGKLAAAKAHYLKAHRLYSSLGDAVDLAYVDWGLGKVALHQGNLAEARRRLVMAHAAFEKGHEHRGASLSKLALASVLHSLGQTKAAEKLFDAGVRQSRRAGLHAHLETYT
jgi:tetratricopeptide (TPR) repeat protein